MSSRASSGPSGSGTGGPRRSSGGSPFGELVGEVVASLPEPGRVRIEAGEGEWLTSDREKLAQALSALLEHALRRSPRGSPCAVGGRSAGREFRIWVRHRGGGIPAEPGEPTFPPFGRGEPPLPGGLGLSVARALVEGLGGRISAAGEGDGATVVTITLPQRRATDLLAELSVLGAASDAEPARPRARRRPRGAPPPGREQPDPGEATHRGA